MRASSERSGDPAAADIEGIHDRVAERERASSEPIGDRGASGIERASSGRNGDRRDERERASSAR